MPQSKQWVCDLKMNGSVKDIAFTADSRHMYSVGSEPNTAAEYGREGARHTGWHGVHVSVCFCVTCSLRHKV